ncbi:class II fructose-bisphosphate aldolase [Clostridia bacterium]|nr:class II fructose-bisphosphate aldolase [Clostridia bacterium]
MSYVNGTEMLRKAMNQGYGIGAFNVYNFETVKAVIQGASEAKAPVMIQIWPGYFDMGVISAKSIASIVKAEAEAADIPVSLHLDHCENLEGIMQSIVAGFGSVMIDASVHKYADNVRISKKIVEIAHCVGVGVEAELGHVSFGDCSAEGAEGQNVLTLPEEAASFIKDTNVDSLAISVGTVHGIYKEEPKLDFSRVERISEITDIPLVLHGSSYVAEEELSRMIKCGITKVNFATELSINMVSGIKEAIKSNPDCIFANEITGVGMDKVKTLVKQKIAALGAEGKG